MTESELQHRDYLSGVWVPSTADADFVLVAVVVVVLIVAAVCR